MLTPKGKPYLCTRIDPDYLPARSHHPSAGVVRPGRNDAEQHCTARPTTC
nr:hypothetical protein GCM10010200_081620 [Actinomadura rugatobispora]